MEERGGRGKGDKRGRERKGAPPLWKFLDRPAFGGEADIPFEP